MKRWQCPSCDDVKLAPAAPRHDDTRRYCLPCSAKSPRLVERVCVARERARETAEQRRAALRVQERERLKAAKAEAVRIDALVHWQLGFDKVTAARRIIIAEQGTYGLSLPLDIGAVQRIAAVERSARCEDVPPVHRVESRVHTVTERTRQSARSDAAFFVALACDSYGGNQGARPFVVAEACYGVRVSPVHGKAWRALYGPLQHAFAERRALHRALSIAISLAGIEWWSDADPPQRSAELGALLDDIAEHGGNAALDADPVPGIPSLRETSAGLSPTTPIWPEFVVPCPPALLGTEVKPS